jgi:hypothetical protein
VTYRVEVTVVASLGEEFGYQLDVAHLRGVVQRAGRGWGWVGSAGDEGRSRKMRSAGDNPRDGGENKPSAFGCGVSGEETLTMRRRHRRRRSRTSSSRNVRFVGVTLRDGMAQRDAE